MPLNGVGTMVATNEAGLSAFHAGAPILHLRDLRTNHAYPVDTQAYHW